MNVLTVLLQAPAGAAGGGSMMWIMLIAMFVIMYFFMIRPQNKKQKEIAISVNLFRLINRLLLLVVSTEQSRRLLTIISYLKLLLT